MELIIISKGLKTTIMAIKKTITNDYEFAEWVKQSDSYSNNFTVEGAKALQEYLDDLSYDLEEDFEFDPVAWCAEFSEYDSFEGFQHDNSYTAGGIEHKGYENIETLDDLKDNTTVIEMENGGLIVQDF